MAPILPEVQYLREDLVRLVRTKGEVKFKGHLFYVGQAFGGQEVAFRPTDQDGCFDLFFSTFLKEKLWLLHAETTTQVKSETE